MGHLNGNAARLHVRLTVRAGADRIDGVDELGTLRVRVRAAPVGGAANDALLKLLADELGVPRSCLAIERGHSARVKWIRVETPHPEAVTSRWPGARVG